MEGLRLGDLFLLEKHSKSAFKFRMGDFYAGNVCTKTGLKSFGSAISLVLHR